MFDINFVKNWILPPRIYEFTTQLYLDSKMKISSETMKTLSKNAKFKDKYKGKRCFVIGNGKSLKKQDLTPLKGEVTIVTNAFIHHPILEQWQPTFYCVGDPIQSVTGPYADEIYDLLKKIPKKISPEEGYFLHISLKSFDVVQNSFPQEKTYYYMGHLSLQKWLRKDMPLDFTSALPPYQITGQLAILIAMYLGCNPIYLLGMDNDYLAQGSALPHFYEPYYKFDKRLLSDAKYFKILKTVTWIWEIYNSYKEYADKNDIKIYNATGGGFLDVFPRKQYETLFNPMVSK